MRVELVGILNVTPDSFSDGGQFLEAQKAIQQAKKLLADGASIIDIGAESTNPWSSPLTSEQEWQRLEPVIKALNAEYYLGNRLSVDTYHPETARRALENGAKIINDVTMFRDPSMVDLAAECRDQAQYIVSHLSPSVSSIAKAHKVIPTTTIEEVKTELLSKRDELVSRGVPLENIILDPGIGFGKTMELNRELLKFAQEVPEHRVMIGYSRKRFLGENRMEIEPNLEAGRTAIAGGAHYLRVHDVAAHQQLINS
jgi:dihydropteroate synthase